MSTSSIVASAVGGSISANIGFADSIKKKRGDHSRCSCEYGYYDILKNEIEQFDNLEDKLNHLYKYKYIKLDLDKQEIFDSVVDILINEIKVKKEEEYYNMKNHFCYF